MVKLKENPLALPNLADDLKVSAAPIIWTGVSILIFFFGSLTLFAIFVPLHSAVHSQGEVVFKNKRQEVQHQDGGIIKNILVKDGDSVIAGQPLIVLEDDYVKPIVDMYEAQALAETATILRLEAEKNDIPQVDFPSNIPRNIVKTETKLFNARREAYIKQINLVKSQIEQTKELLKGTIEQLSFKKQEIKLLKEQFEANVSLHKDGYVNRTIVIDIEKALAEKTGEYEQIAANIATNIQRQDELAQKILAIKAERVQQAADEIKQSALKRLELEERVRPSRASMSRQIIRAPVEGKIVGLKVSTVGGVVAPGEPLMEIAPKKDNLIVECKIGVNDIGDVRIGQNGKILLMAFKSYEYPQLDARVVYVSDDRLTEKSVQGEIPYYAAYLEIEDESFKLFDKDDLLPGMQADVTITTKPRTALDYFIGPLRDRVGRALHAR